MFEILDEMIYRQFQSVEKEFIQQKVSKIQLKLDQNLHHEKSDKELILDQLSFE